MYFEEVLLESCPKRGYVLVKKAYENSANPFTLASYKWLILKAKYQCAPIHVEPTLTTLDASFRPVLYHSALNQMKMENDIHIL